MSEADTALTGGFMKKMLFVFAVLLVCWNGYAQTDTSAETGNTTTVSGFYAGLPYFSEWNDIELIGWTNSGLVAYLQGDSSVQSWTTTISLVIFDAVSDITTDELGITLLWELDEEDKIVRVLPLEKITATLSNWNGMLEKNGIGERINDITGWINSKPFYVFPCIRGETAYDCRFDIVREEDDAGGATKITWSLIGSNGLKTKTLATGIEHNNNPHGYLDSTILGYYKSPYEDRLLVVTTHHYISLGDHYHRIGLYGFSLDTGFE